MDKEKRWEYEAKKQLIFFIGCFFSGIKQLFCVNIDYEEII